MYAEKGFPFGFPLWDPRERRREAHRGTRAPDNACGPGVRYRAGVRGWLQLEPESRVSQMLRQKMWVPWNGLIVIGKRKELLRRNTQKPRLWNPKPEPEYWTLEDVEKTVSKGESGLSPERRSVRLPPPGAAGASRASAGLGRASPEEGWGKPEHEVIDEGPGE
ncbi:PREDICTED: uncharacterized protein LOC107533543 [Miniopterus natalensis]|uniref:uncharacterized protein LOC107533543 n=1 Tax=Miniopterus natalensis TaxID=291302 RepID=UPI0007A6FEF2|nr:PREDICTED: uncharacterized protein LOC107533543 [Miniopterus natalensis]